MTSSIVKLRSRLASLADLQREPSQANLMGDQVLVGHLLVTFERGKLTEIELSNKQRGKWTSMPRRWTREGFFCRYSRLKTAFVSDSTQTSLVNLSQAGTYCAMWPVIPTMTPSLRHWDDRFIVNNLLQYAATKVRSLMSAARLSFLCALFTIPLFRPQCTYFFWLFSH